MPPRLGADRLSVYPLRMKVGCASTYPVLSPYGLRRPIRSAGHDQGQARRVERPDVATAIAAFTRRRASERITDRDLSVGEMDRDEMKS